jgi:hypothetical protein
VVAAVHVAVGAALIAAGIVALGEVQGEPGEGAAARVYRTVAGVAEAGPDLLPVDLHAMVRETVAGERILVVGGAIESRRGTPVAPIVVAVEVVDPEGRVLAGAEGAAGRVPTEAEVDRAAPAPAAPALARAPGERVPFLVVVGPPPAGLDRAGVRVSARLGDAAPAPVSEASR